MNTNEHIIKIKKDEQDVQHETYGAFSESCTRALARMFGDNKLKAYAVFYVWPHSDFMARKTQALARAESESNDGDSLSVDDVEIAVIFGNGKMVMFWASEWGGLKSFEVITNSVGA